MLRESALWMLEESNCRGKEPGFQSSNKSLPVPWFTFCYKWDPLFKKEKKNKFVCPMVLESRKFNSALVPDDDLPAVPQHGGWSRIVG